jgi:hypothetical protein
MMRLKPQPATVIALLALFIALGGTSYAVTGRTAHSSAQINGAQLEEHTVSGTKLEDHTVTGRQVNVSGFPTVPSAVFAGQASLATNAENAVDAKHATDAKSATTAETVTGTIAGSQVSGAVPNATLAGSATTAGTITGTIAGSQVSGAVADATNATLASSATTAGTITGTIAGSQVSGAVANATNAADATAVDDDEVSNISVWSSSSSDVTLVSDIAGLTLAMRCTGGDVDIDATTADTDASYGMGAVANATATSFVKAEGDFTTGSTITSTIAAPSQVSFSYEEAGAVASGTFSVFDDAGTCAAFGVAEYGG